MATIALYAHKINQMPDMLKEVRQSVTNYKTELLALQRKTSLIQKSVCNLESVSDMIKSSTEVQEKKVASFETLNQNNEQFIEDTVRIDRNVADIKKKFPGKYDENIAQAQKYLDKLLQEGRVK